jgi:hypothetical protein
MKITFVGGYTYRFSKSDGDYGDYILAGMKDGDTLWRDPQGNEHKGATVFQNVVTIQEVARPPQAVNEQR